MKYNYKEITEKVFLSGESVFIIEGPAGTGDYYVHCRNVDTDEKACIPIGIAFEKVKSYENDLKRQTEKEEENDYAEKRIIELARMRYDSKESISPYEMKLLLKLMDGNFNIEMR